MKKYVISATAFDTKADAEERIQDWIDLGTYNKESIIYEVDEDTPSYMGTIKLKKLNKP